MRKLVIVTLLILSFVVAPAAYGQVIQMKLGHFAADSHPGNLASKMFAEAVEKERTGRSKSRSTPTTPWGPRRKCSSRTSWAPWT